jgi:hypothetical protein
MLGNINTCRPQPAMCSNLPSDDRYSRNPKDDMKEAVDLLWKFKEGLDRLHPDCTTLMERLLAPLQRY